MAKLPKKKSKSDVPSRTIRDRPQKEIARWNYGTPRHLILIVLIAIAGVITYSNTFHSPFIFDDNVNIADNPVIKNLDNFLSSSKGYQHNPNRFFGYLSFALNYRFGGVNTTGYHIVNLAIHVLNSVLVYFLVVLIFSTPMMQDPTAFSPHAFIRSSSTVIALFSALIFAVHPVQTQAVTYIVQRFTSLATLFYLASLVLYLKGRLSAEKGRGPVRVALYLMTSVLAAILAMKTKEIAITLPLSIALTELVFFSATPQKRALFLTPFILTLAIIPINNIGIGKPFGEVLAELSSQTRVQTHMGRWDYFVTQISVITTYIRLLFLPVGQNLDYDFPISHSLFTPSVFPAFLFLLSALSAAGYVLYRSYKLGRNSNPALRLIAFGVVWFFLGLSVESSVIPILDVIFEHRVYLPSIGLIIASTVLFVYVTNKRKMVTYGVLGLVTVVLCSVAYARNLVWKSGITLYEDVVEKSPNKARSHHNLGVVYLNAGKIDEAIAALQKAVLLKPDYAMAFYNLGVSYVNKGQFDKAIGEFHKAIAQKPVFAEAHDWMGIAYAGLGQTAIAIE